MAVTLDHELVEKMAAWMDPSTVDKMAAYSELNWVGLLVGR